MSSCLLIEENLYLLVRLRDTLAQLTPAQYTAVEHRWHNSSIGAHTRHVLDHYQAFVDGLEHGHINYDKRAREPELEEQHDAAIERIEHLLAQLDIEPLLSTPVRVTLDASLRFATPTVEQQSTIGRELTFLHAHTVHHQAYIVFILRTMDIEPAAPEMGYAPATLRHREQDSCAH